jgi:hypothetical protein
MCKKDFGENERNKGNRHGVELALLGFDCQAANLPHSLDQPVVLWSNIEFGRYWFGVLPLHVVYLLKTGYYKEPEASPTRTSLRFEERKIYKWRWERRLQSGQSNFAPIGWKIKTFSWEERRLVRGRTSYAGKGSSTAQGGGAQQKFRCRWVVTVVYECKHGGVVQPCPHQILRCSM